MELAGSSSLAYASLAALQAPPAGTALSSAGSGGQTGSNGNKGRDDSPSNPGATSSTGEPLTKEQEAQVRDLKKRDAEVKAHEQAHAAVGGAYAGAPKYTYTRGPDGKRYAVGGEVQIDTSPERTPEATIRKMDIVVRAALAPAEPSSQDRAVARQAQQQRQDAQTQLAQMQAEERTSTGKPEGRENAVEGLDSSLAAQIIGQASHAQSGAASGAPTLGTAAGAYASTANLVAEIFSAAT